MRALISDLADAARALRRAPGSSLVVVAVLGLAIGATATLWTAVDAVLLRPLSFPEPESLVRVLDVQDGARWALSPPNFVDYRREVASFERLAAFNEGSFALVAADGPAVQIPGAQVTSEFFATLGAPALVGRYLGAADDGEPVVAIARFLRGQLYELSPTDPATLAAAAVFLLATAFAAAWTPARRAGRLDPLTGLREE